MDHKPVDHKDCKCVLIVLCALFNSHVKFNKLGVRSKYNLTIDIHKSRYWAYDSQRGLIITLIWVTPLPLKRGLGWQCKTMNHSLGGSRVKQDLEEFVRCMIVILLVCG